MYWELGFLRVFLCTIVSPYFIVKSLQLRGRRQTAKPRKYCLVRVIVFFGMCFLYLFLFLTGWDFWLNSLQGSHISLDGELKNHRITVSRILELSRNKYSATKYLNKCLYSTGMGYNDSTSCLRNSAQATVILQSNTPVFLLYNILIK